MRFIIVLKKGYTLFFKIYEAIKMFGLSKTFNFHYIKCLVNFPNCHISPHSIIRIQREEFLRWGIFLQLEILLK